MEDDWSRGEMETESRILVLVILHKKTLVIASKIELFYIL